MGGGRGYGRRVARAWQRGPGAAEEPGSTSSANEESRYETCTRAAAADLVLGVATGISFRPADKEHAAAAAASFAVDGPQEVANGGGDAGRA
jgi:hypothetical protein